jgi:hypothetical protein
MAHHLPGARPSLATDASNRALRTFLQALAVDVLLALALVLYNVFQQANSWGSFDWNVLGFLLVKTFVVSAASYFMRRVLDPSSFPTPLPPAPVPAPADPPVNGDFLG